VVFGKRAFFWGGIRLTTVLFDFFFFFFFKFNDLNESIFTN